MADFFIPTRATHQAGPTTNSFARITALIISLRVVPSGLSIVANEAIEPDATIAACPFSIIITPLLSKGALLPLLQDASFLERWTERQRIIVYICFHWIPKTET